METQTIDRLFLELSQVTQATTRRERELAEKAVKLQNEIDLAYAMLNDRGYPNVKNAGPKAELMTLYERMAMVKPWAGPAV